MRLRDFALLTALLILPPGCDDAPATPGDLLTVAPPDEATQLDLASDGAQAAADLALAPDAGADLAIVVDARVPPNDTWRPDLAVGADLLVLRDLVGLDVAVSADLAAGADLAVPPPDGTQPADASAPPDGTQPADATAPPPDMVPPCGIAVTSPTVTWHSAVWLDGWLLYENAYVEVARSGGKLTIREPLSASFHCEYPAGSDTMTVDPVTCTAVCCTGAAGPVEVKVSASGWTFSGNRTCDYRGAPLGSSVTRIMGTR